jgi:hypothetical protein
MRKRSWPNRKNRPCPDCSRMLTYTRKDTFDRAVGNNSVCKSCAQMDRKLTLETITKMKQPKTIEHKKKISIVFGCFILVIVSSVSFLSICAQDLHTELFPTALSNVSFRV